MLASRGDAQAQLLHFVMIKPSHYDDDGYPIQDPLCHPFQYLGLPERAC
jgi:hypothetical protein